MHIHKKEQRHSHGFAIDYEGAEKRTTHVPNLSHVLIEVNALE